MARARIQIMNPTEGGFFYWLFRYSLLAVLGTGLLVLHVLVGVYLHFARTVPTVPDLSTYAQRAPGITTVRAGDGTLLAELASERREVIGLEQIPQTLIDAVIATEDRRFFEHRGLDLRGLGRALRENLRHGRVSQGGSTITQQVAKSFLSPERTFTRKIREAILARRLEARFTKREILALYLNHIFMGHGSYGVQAASRRYFDRNVWELGVGDLALLAGLAKAPTRYSPIEHPLAAQARRDTVLRNMVEVGKLTQAQADAILGKRIELRQRRDVSRDVSPYFVEHVRREALRLFGQQPVYEGGLRIETTVQPYMDVLAADNVDHATRQIDKRQGYRGPEARLDADGQKLFLARATVKYAAPLEEERLYLGLVTGINGRSATVQIGPHTTDLPLVNMLWAARYVAHDSTNDRFVHSVGEALRVGDVIWVKRAQRAHTDKFSEFVYVPLVTKKTDAEGSGSGEKPATGGGAKLALSEGGQGAKLGVTGGEKKAALPALEKKAAATTAATSSKRASNKVASRGRGRKNTGKAGESEHSAAPKDSAAGASKDSGVLAGTRYVPGTGVQVVMDAQGTRLAAQSPAPGKRIEVGEAVWLPEQSRKLTPAMQKEVMLEQAPRPQGALYTFDLKTGYVLAMAGGNDFDRSEYNRVVQACRQPGSTYKPVYYSLALDRGYHFDTVWNDRIRTEVDPVTGEEWVPQNIDGSYGTTVNLERALVWSKNPPSLEIFKTLGKKDVAAWARRLGFTTPIHADDALALGASCVRIDEISRAFALFATGGRPVETVAIKRVLDRAGRVLYDMSAWDDPMLDGGSRLDRIVALAGRDRRPIIHPRTAWLTDTLLRRVVSQGHSKPIRDTKIIAAGKTGTSSRTSDVWFVGHTSRWLTTAWVGDDTYERQLGYTDASFTISVPMWARYLHAANREQSLVELPQEKSPIGKPQDRGGPLLPGWPPPPLSTGSPDARSYLLPEHLRHLRVQPSPGAEGGAGAPPTIGAGALKSAVALPAGTKTALRPVEPSGKSGVGGAKGTAVKSGRPMMPSKPGSKGMQRRQASVGAAGSGQ